jgi:hypothetical protein
LRWPLIIQQPLPRLDPQWFIAIFTSRQDVDRHGKPADMIKQIYAFEKNEHLKSDHLI